MSSMHEVSQEGEALYGEWVERLIEEARSLGIDVPDEVEMSDLSYAVDTAIARAEEKVEALRRLHGKFHA